MSFSFITTLDDKEPPLVTCPESFVKELTASESEVFVNWEDPNAMDNIGVVSLSKDEQHTSGGRFGIGIYKLTYTVRDAANNSATCSFTFDVRQYSKYVLGSIFKNILSVWNASQFISQDQYPRFPIPS